MSHPSTQSLQRGRSAVITGAASGIGLAAAHALAALGLKVMLADLPGPALDAAQAAVPGALAVATDVSDPAAVQRLAEAAFEAFGAVNLLMNNAASGANPGKPWENSAGWGELLGVNLGGVIHGTQAFVPRMIAGGQPGLVVNTGSKQGITLPPGNSAYNVSKAGVKAFTELLAHELRLTGAPLAAHLLIPGFTFTGMTSRPQKPAAAWGPEQVVAFMLQGIGQGDFYILCPDNDVDRATDEKRMAWTAQDIIQNRPPLSRWHPDHAQAFAAYMAKDG